MPSAVGEQPASALDFWKSVWKRCSSRRILTSNRHAALLPGKGNGGKRSHGMPRAFLTFGGLRETPLVGKKPTAVLELVAGLKCPARSDELLVG